ncbi:hypothetical protein ACHHYP_09515 [Achlya hypogyna]|uniref:Putative auto-transporter adhesin head GIN domain-containing protein n=1 Tax=Achlya hypogyna TaxID=1202772 RepID=A0A1V9YN08_ACHHY|nr:hypothetical protein ACHHYP_09515 [Achlya hypogyna]
MTDTFVSTATTTRTWDLGNMSLEGLFLHLPGRVFVNYNASANTSVRVTSDGLLDSVHAEVVNHSLDSMRILDGYVVPQRGNHSVLNLTANSPVKTTGTLLVHVVVNKPVAVVTSLAETVLGTDTLATKASKLRLLAYSSGSLQFSTDTDIDVNELELATFGSGAIDMRASHISVASRWTISAYSSGAIGVVAGTAVTPVLAASSYGSGSIFLEAATVAKEVSSDTYSSGSINYYPSGSCDDSRVQIFGNGQVNAGSLICTDTTANIISSGNATIQATRTLRATTFAKGSVLYFNHTPTELPQQSKLFQSKGPNVHPTNANTYATWAPLPLPPNAPIVVEIGPRSWSLTASSKTNLGGFGELAIAGLALLLLVAVLVVKRTTGERYQRIK